MGVTRDFLQVGCATNCKKAACILPERQGSKPDNRCKAIEVTILQKLKPNAVRDFHIGIGIALQVEP
jgi:hypothetical protein